MKSVAEQIREEGREEGRRERFLMHLLKHKFHTIPKIYIDKVTRANSEDLMHWIVRAVDVDSLESLFSD